MAIRFKRKTAQNWKNEKVRIDSLEKKKDRNENSNKKEVYFLMEDKRNNIARNFSSKRWSIAGGVTDNTRTAFGFKFFD